MYNHEKFINSIQESFNNYLSYGKRSNKRILPIHNYIAETVEQIFGNEYEVFCSGKNKEIKVKGKYYNKNIDITVTKDLNPIFCIGVKFITSNFKQNSNNYFESMLGETANIQSTNNIPYAHIVILRTDTPYYNKDGMIERIEQITESDINKYLKLYYDTSVAHKPFATAIMFVEERENIIKESFPGINPEIIEILKNNLSVERLFQNITDFKYYHKNIGEF